MIKYKLDNVSERIKKAALKADRNPSDIVLVCVTKEASVKGLSEAIENGITDIGENRVKDAILKYESLNNKAGIRWHFIGHLQTNKVKKVVRIFDLIHSVDSFRLAEEIQKQAEEISKMQSILLQVNVSGEETKYGINAKDTESLIKAIRSMKNVMLLGMMTIAPYSTNPEDSRVHFRKLRELRDSLLSYNSGNIDMKHLSMGMSGDFEVAIEEGADIVRVGSAIFKE